MPEASRRTRHHKPERTMAVATRLRDQRQGKKYGALDEPITFEGAWDAAGARKLARLLPEHLSDIRDEIVRRFLV